MQSGLGPTKRTIEQVRKALKRAGGLRTETAKILRVSRATVYHYLERWPELHETIQDAEEGLKDVAEGKLAAAIRGGDLRAVTYYLDRKARDRGYGNRQEIVGKNGGPIEVTDSRDFSGLTDDELLSLRDLHRKALETRQDGA